MRAKSRLGQAVTRDRPRKGPPVSTQEKQWLCKQDGERRGGGEKRRRHEGCPIARARLDGGRSALDVGGEGWALVLAPSVFPSITLAECHRAEPEHRAGHLGSRIWSSYRASGEAAMNITLDASKAPETSTLERSCTTRRHMCVATHPQVLAGMRHTSLIRRSNSGRKMNVSHCRLLLFRECV
jgi:hypothetical protein